MRKYISILIICLCLLLPATNAKYVISGKADISISTASFNVEEITEPLYEIEVPTREYSEISIKNNGKLPVKGNIVLEGNKLKEFEIDKNKTETYKLYLTSDQFTSLELNEKYPLKVNYISPYKVTREVAKVKRIPLSIFGKLRSINLGSDKNHNIDFSRVNSGDNGEGLYMLDATKDAKYPTFYFRGSHDVNNNLIYAGFCWKIIRTTDYKGVRLIYDGISENGVCKRKETPDTLINPSAQFNPLMHHKMYAGYMYGTSGLPYENVVHSIIKKNIDEWYVNNIQNKGYGDYIDQNALYCNDRSEGVKEGLSTNFGSRDRLINNNPSLACSDKNNFSVILGNRKLEYGVALLTVDEAILAGYVDDKTANDNNYLNNNQVYWTLSPHNFTGVNIRIFTVNKNKFGSLFPSSTAGARPVLTIKGSLPLIDGDGSRNSPYIITSTLRERLANKSLGNDKELGIDFSKDNSSSNGEGVYLLDETKDAARPIYYYRGTHHLKNNVIYAGKCWKLIRTTETGGVKAIYHGTPYKGKCPSNINNASIGKSIYNPDGNKKKYVGYMYGGDIIPYQNGNESAVKKYLDEWFMNNLLTSGEDVKLDKNAIYCNDREEAKTENNITYYGPSDRFAKSAPSLVCKTSDSFAVSSFNKKLKYPVSLLTLDEAMLAGINKNTLINKNYYLYNGTSTYLLSPDSADINQNVKMWMLKETGEAVTTETVTEHDIRPVITFDPRVSVISGDGSINTPYII